MIVRLVDVLLQISVGYKLSQARSAASSHQFARNGIVMLIGEMLPQFPFYLEPLRTFVTVPVLTVHFIFMTF